MKKWIFFVAFALVLSSCEKEVLVDEVKYEVILTNSTTWHGAYVDQNAQTIGVPSAASGWTYTFKNTNRIFAALINAYPDGLSSNADARMNIYVNGNLVASGLCSVFPQVMYEFP